MKINMKTSRHLNFPARQSGYTLLELLTAMSLGIFLMTGLYQLYISNNDSTRLQQATSQVQRNGQFALDIITNKINTAGYTGFYGDMSVGVENVLRDPNNQIWDISRPLQGFNNVASTDIIAGITGFVSGTDILLLKQMEKGTVIKRNPSSQTVVLEATSEYKNGDIVFLSDIDQASSYQASSITTISGETTITMNLSTTIAPGNNIVISNAFSKDAEFGKLSVRMYYLKTGKNGKPALFEAILVNTGTKNELEEYELASNILDLQLTFGEDSNSDKVVDIYKDASAILDWGMVANVGIALLVSSKKAVPNGESYDYIFDSPNFTYKKDSPSEAGPSNNQTATLKKTFRSISAIRNRVL